MTSYLDSAQIDAMATAMGTWESTTSSQEWASASREFVDIEWGALSLLWDPTLPTSAPLVQADLTPAEEALEGYLPPEIKGVADLQAEFPIQLEEDSGGIGLKRFHVSWLDGRRYCVDGEPYDYIKESESTCDDHHAFFYEWTQIRLLKTLSHYKNLFVLHETKKGVATFSLREKLMPLQMLMRGPFVWDQEGATISVRAHGKKMEAVYSGSGSASNGRGPVPEKFVREIAGRMMERLRESEACEVVEASAGSRFLFQVNLLGVEEAPAAKVAPKALVTPSSPLAPKAPAPVAVAPLAPASVAVAPPAPASVAVAPALALGKAETSAPVAVAPLAPAPKALDTLKSFSRYVRWDRDGYHHLIEVLRSHHASARRIHDDLLDALRKCGDCNILPPPKNSPYLFVVQVLAPRR
jgi:hypothetical protein